MKKVAVFGTGEFPKKSPSKNNPLAKMMKKMMVLTEKEGNNGSKKKDLGGRKDN